MTETIPTQEGLDYQTLKDSPCGSRFRITKNGDLLTVVRAHNTLGDDISPVVMVENLEEPSRLDLPEVWTSLYYIIKSGWRIVERLD